MTSPSQAAAATLAAGSCRLRLTHFTDPPPERFAFTMVEVGVADLDRRRTHMVSESTPEALDDVGEAIIARWPWLEDLGDDEPADDDTEFPHVWADGVSYWRGPRGWTRAGHANVSMHPLWIVEQLAAGLADAARFRLPLSPAVHGQARIDGDGRLERVTWSHNPRERSRRPAAVRRAWRTLELTDYGTPVDIPVPDLAPPEPRGAAARDLWRLARVLHRTRRDWQRR